MAAPAPDWHGPGPAARAAFLAPGCGKIVARREKSLDREHSRFALETAPGAARTPRLSPLRVRIGTALSTQSTPRPTKPHKARSNDSVATIHAIEAVVDIVRTGD